jgi:hypothetical protein
VLYFLSSFLGFGERHFHKFSFSSSHGLRQGVPLSHLLFVIVKKALGRMLFAVMSGVCCLVSLWGQGMLVGLISLTFCLLLIL